VNVLKRLLILCTVIFVAVFTFTQVLRRTSMFFPSAYPAGDWNASALTPVPVNKAFVTDDGLKLHGWLFRASGPNRPLVIWCHGNGGNITDRADVAARLTRRGLSVLLFDWRGYGRSEGKPSENGLYHDAEAAYNFATKSLGVSPGDIVMYGESLGGPYAARVASQRKVRCVIIENSFPSLAAMGNAIYGPVPIGWFAPFAMTTLRWLNDAHVPVLVMHGRRDNVIPFRLGLQLYDGLRVPKEMLVSAKAGHDEIAEVEGERYDLTVTRFIEGAGP
jgi:fermentation-respiration switch protein FrsA (DUF1100 family)